MTVAAPPSNAGSALLPLKILVLGGDDAQSSWRAFGEGGYFWKVNITVELLVPFTVVTVTGTFPGVPAGEVAVIEVSDVTVNSQASIRNRLPAHR